MLWKQKIPDSFLGFVKISPLLVFFSSFVIDGYLAFYPKTPINKERVEAISDLHGRANEKLLDGNKVHSPPMISLITCGDGYKELVGCVDKWNYYFKTNYNIEVSIGDISTYNFDLLEKDNIARFVDIQMYSVLLFTKITQSDISNLKKIVFASEIINQEGRSVEGQYDWEKDQITISLIKLKNYVAVHELAHTQVSNRHFSLLEASIFFMDNNSKSLPDIFSKYGLDAFIKEFLRLKDDNKNDYRFDEITGVEYVPTSFTKKLSHEEKLKLVAILKFNNAHINLGEALSYVEIFTSGYNDKQMSDKLSELYFQKNIKSLSKEDYAQVNYYYKKLVKLSSKYKEVVYNENRKNKRIIAFENIHIVLSNSRYGFLVLFGIFHLYTLKYKN